MANNLISQLIDAAELDFKEIKTVNGYSFTLAAVSRERMRMVAEPRPHGFITQDPFGAGELEDQDRTLLQVPFDCVVVFAGNDEDVSTDPLCVTYKDAFADIWKSIMTGSNINALTFLEHLYVSGGDPGSYHPEDKIFAVGVSFIAEIWVDSIDPFLEG